MDILGKLKSRDRQAIIKFQKRVQESLGKRVLSTKLFGSKLSGKDVEGSDIDILVIVSRNTPEIKNQVIDIAFEVNLTYDTYISPRVISADVFQSSLWRETPFIKNLEKEAVPL